MLGAERNRPSNEGAVGCSAVPRFARIRFTTSFTYQFLTDFFRPPYERVSWDLVRWRA